MKTKKLTLESFKSVVKRIIKEEMNENDSNVKQWDGTPLSIYEALKLWPKNEKKPILGVENREWTFESDGIIAYGDTPLEALYHCANMNAQSEKNSFGIMDNWNKILDYLTS
jgi:hypothetical protein